MPTRIHRVVLDTNVVARGFVNSKSASGRVLGYCETRKAIPLLSRPVLKEYQTTLLHPAFTSRYPHVDFRSLERMLARLSYVGELLRVSARFLLPRDPKDAQFVELAISGEATAIVSYDSDLLDLNSGRDDAAKRFRRRLPHTRVLRPEELLFLIDGPN